MDDVPFMQRHLPATLDGSEQALEEVFRHTPVGVVLTDLHGTILDANDAFCTMLGSDRDHVVGQAFVAFLHPDDVDNAIISLGQLREQEARSVENVRRWLASDGRTITAKVTASVVRSLDREPICGIAFIENIGERLRMENALRHSEARYRRVVEDQTELIVRCLPDGTRTFVNEAYCRYSEAPAEQIIGSSFFPCIPEEERDLVYRKYAALSPDNPVITDEHRVFTPAGTLRWHRWTDRGIFDAAGNLVEIQAVGRDITEERESQELLRRSEENYRRLFSALPVGVWETDFSEVLAELRRRGLDTPERIIAAVEARPEIFADVSRSARIVTANDAALRMTGASTPAEILPWITSRYTDDAVSVYVRGAAPLLAGDVLEVDLELPLRGPGGERLDLLQRLSRGPNWPAEPRLIAITLDVTKRKHTERDLAHRRRILEQAEVLARIGSWDWDPGTDRVYGSAGFWRIFEGRAEARSATLDEAIGCLREDLRSIVWRNLASLASTGERIPEAERDLVTVHPDGTTVKGRGRPFVERDASGRVVRVYGVVHDLTEQRRLEAAAQLEREALTQADKMISLGVLVSGVAHEINNPNHSIMLNASLLRDAWKGVAPLVDAQVASDPDARVGALPWRELRDEMTSMIDDIEHASERIRGIVTELRGFALDHDAGERSPLSINDVVKSSLRLLGNHIRKATTRFSTTLASDLPPVLGNARRLEQVLINLMINACQALENTDCAIAIETGRTETHVVVRVIDEGRGIAPGDLRKITEPFFTTKRASGGSGLGLAVSERIAQEHGGALTFESEQGLGTTATLSIPIEVP